MGSNNDANFMKFLEICTNVSIALMNVQLDINVMAAAFVGRQLVVGKVKELQGANFTYEPYIGQVHGIWQQHGASSTLPIQKIQATFNLTKSGRIPSYIKERLKGTRGLH